LLFVISSILLFKQLRITQSIYRWQTALLITSTLLPMVSDSLYVLGLWPTPNFNPTTIVFSISGTLLTLSLFHFRFLDLMPVARNKLIENMSDAMLVLDMKNRIVDLNPQMQTLLEVQSKEAIGKTVSQFITKWETQLATLFDLTEAHREMVFDRNGVSIYYDVHISILRETNGNVVGRLIVLRNISHRVHLENELRIQNEELRAFTQMVAHDLKSPVNLILGLSEILPTMPASEDDALAGNYAEIIHQTAQKMQHIIDALLLLAHVRQQKVEPQLLDMTPIILEVKQRLYYKIAESGAAISYPDSWPLAIGYAPWIEEVWVNYVSNSLKYGGQPPQLTLGFTLQENGMIRFWVRDNGSGISAADQAGLFVPFTRLDQATMDGNGLGLSIVKRIVERLGGTVGVESEMGNGSLFYFCLPVFVEENDRVTALEAVSNET